MAMQAITGYGPYYRSSRRAIDTTSRALGKPVMTPEQIAAERYGEIESQRSEAERRRAERFSKRQWSAEFGLRKDAAENLEEAQQVAGAYKMMEGFGELGEGFGISTGTGQPSGTATAGSTPGQVGVTGGAVPADASWTDLGNRALTTGIPAALGMAATAFGGPIPGMIVGTTAKIFGPAMVKGVNYLGKELGLWSDPDYTSPAYEWGIGHNFEFPTGNYGGITETDIDWGGQFDVTGGGGAGGGK